MSSISSNLVRAGLPRGIRITTASSPYQHRSISWMPWEQPNPKLYIDQSDPVYNLPPPEDPAKKAEAESEAKKPHADTTGTKDVRKAGEAAVARGTAAVGAGKQEVSTSGKTVPTSIQVGSLRVPSTQTRSMHTASGSTPSSAPALLYLPTTLLRIPGMPSTWPGESPASPDQPRIRKRRMEVIHEFSSKPQQLIRAAAAITTASASAPEDNKSTRQVLETLGDMTSASPQTYNEDGGNGDDGGDLDPNTSLSFEKAVARYMEGVKAREEALAVADQSGDPAVSRQVLDEVERIQWRRVVWAAVENLPKLPPESGEGEKGKDTEGKAKDTKGKGKKRA